MKTVKKTLTIPNVSRETFDLLNIYYDELMLWNKSTSLTEVLGRDDYFNRHIYDALQLVELLPDGVPILDIGSGAGIPGVPLGLMQKKVTMVESVKKKCIFLNYIIKKLSLSDACVVNSRVESLFFDYPILVTARALSSLTVLLGYMNSVSRETMGVFLKGKMLWEEILEAEKVWLFDYDVYKSFGDGYIVKINNLKVR